MLFRSNPAWEAVRRLPDTIGGAEVVKVEIPVVFGRASAAVDAAIEANRPDIVLCVGQAGGRCKITPEFVGINYIDARIPDNEGNQPLAKRVVEDGPDAYFDKFIFSNKSIKDFRFFDARGYKKIVNKYYGERIYGGPRSRIRTSIQLDIESLSRAYP